MTSILSSLIDFSSNRVSSTSRVASDQQLLDQLNKKQNTGSINNPLGAAFSLNLSDTALNFLSDSSNINNQYNNSATNTLSALSYSGSVNNSQKVAGGFEDMLSSLISSASGQDINIGNTPSFESILASAGPLPSFIHEVDVRLNLNDTQEQALKDIALANMNATKTPETIQKIAKELQLAGIY
ncbi:MAG: hypothetical protein ABL857_04990 [Rickettsiales bacterium]